MIHTYVGRMRKSLEPYDVTIETRGDGYLVYGGDHTVDVDEFTSLVRAAGDLTDPADRVRHFDTALALWRGPLLADVADEALRTRLDPALVELRLSTAELRAEAQLEMGLHDQVITDVGPLVEAAPTRERLIAQLMTALYRAGRQAEALAHFRRTRSLLVRDLGIEPGPDLQALHGRMLRSDPSLDRPPQPIFAIRFKEHWLPWNTSGHPALEFCNTYAGWGHPPLPGSEWLRGYSTLAVWAGYHDLIDDWTVNRIVRLAIGDPTEAAAVLDAARALRTALYAALTRRDAAEAFRAVAACAEAGARMSTFRLGDDGLGRWGLAPEAGLRAPLFARRPCRRRPADRSPPVRGVRVPGRTVRLAVPGPQRRATVLQHRDVRPGRDPDHGCRPGRGTVGRSTPAPGCAYRMSFG